MYNLTGVINDTQPKLPENPLIYFEEYNNKLLCMYVQENVNVRKDVKTV